MRGNIQIVCPEVEELAFLDFLWDEDEDEFVCSVNNHELLLQMIENKNGDAEPYKNSQRELSSSLMVMMDTKNYTDEKFTG